MKIWQIKLIVYKRKKITNNFNEDKYKTNTIQKGELKILFHDKVKGIIAGTFWFEAINSNGEIVKVTEGRFDTFLRQKNIRQHTLQAIWAIGLMEKLVCI